MMNVRLWHQMNSLKSDFEKLTHRMTPGLMFSNDHVEDKEFLGKLPFSTIESVIACEKILEADSRAKEKFVCIFISTIV